MSSHEELASATKPVTNGEEAYNLAFTNSVIAATGPKANRRLAEIMPSLIRHLHDFAREVDLTVDEWMAGVELINECGRMSTDKRNETALLCAVLGLESLLNETALKRPGAAINSEQAAATATPTPSAILGPFYRPDAPLLPNYSSILRSSMPDIDLNTCLLTGRVLSAPDLRPLPSAVVDMWLAAPNGLYEQQDPSQPDMNLRGRFLTDASGRYAAYAVRPVAYPIPADGPAGKLLELLDRREWRPAHVHFIVSAEGHRSVTTQVFDAADKERLGDDAVFATKDELVVEFVPREGDSKAKWILEYDFVLQPRA